MAVYSATFTATAVTAAQDVFEIVAPSDGKVAILGVSLGQYSDAGDADAELLSVRFIRAHSTSGSGGAAVTPTNLHGHTGALAAASTVERNNTTQATGGSPLTLFASSWNVQVPFEWRASPFRDEIIILAPSQRFVVALTAPADSITLNGTLLFEEIGQ